MNPGDKERPVDQHSGKGYDPKVEEAYWREQYRREPYYRADRDFESWAPAYQVGYEGRMRYGGRPFDELDADLQQDYLRLRGNDMPWDEVRPATRAAWDRLDRRIQDLTRN
jgi:hypothetical protein